MKLLVVLVLCLASGWSANIQKKPLHNVERNLGPRIINGMPAEETEFPFMAAIYSTTSLGRYFCGGAVIDRRWILTAGHCVQNAVSFVIQLGSVSLSSTDVNRVTVPATTSVVHPDFNNETFVNNIGLINLPDDLRLNDYVNVVALPSEVLAENTVLTSLGWGQTDDEHSGPVDNLQKVLVVSLLNEHCQNIFGSQIVDSMVCAMGSYNEGTCIGDIGGPLVQTGDSQPVIVAVASFLSFNGCESLDPSGYERVFDHVDWIKSVTNIA
ncbi:hypothetical protein Zmor_015444 [Zophobas morio]|uniref:Peptidase S1 domain-containing protein n=1 Tax=Zophobas morio TaxID=2755281 RepID=A0AA38MH77_9CUCU|nr:hypothetical protein Zmor_015444 [Zophobas morio]